MSAYQATRKVRDAIINNFRNYFSTHPTYTYISLPEGYPDMENTKIMIADITPQEEFKIPMIYINTVSGTESRMLDYDLQEGDDDSEIRSTYITLTVDIKIRAYDTIVRDELEDALYASLKEFLDDLSESGIIVIKVDFSPESREFINDRWWYTSGFSLNVATEWTETFTVEGEIIEKVTVDPTVSDEVI